MAGVRQRTRADQRLDVLRVAAQRLVDHRLGLAVERRVAGVARFLQVGRAKHRVSLHVGGVLLHALLIIPDQLVGFVDRALGCRVGQALCGEGGHLHRILGAPRNI